MALIQIPGLKDVAFEVLKFHRFPDSRKPIKLKVAWYNVVRKDRPWPMGLTQNIELTEEQWSSRTF